MNAQQLSLPPTGEKINVHNMMDRKHEAIRYIGEATKQFDGTWRCLADIGGMLCLVEVKVREVS